MKQLFSFLNIQFVLKYLWNPGCKHSISARSLRTSQIYPIAWWENPNIFTRDSPPPSNFIFMSLSTRYHAISTKKHSEVFFYNLVKLVKMQSTFGETKRAHLLQGPLVHAWKTVSRSKQACEQLILSNLQCQYTILRYWQGLMLLSPLWWAIRHPANGHKHKKIVSFLMFWHSKLLFTELIR